ncbi:MAG: plasmid mobilization relaxosome protein MobC [Hyphomicrobiales bacterium]|nr:plasmid mobilization relaxosome protein MobC [Hyphomicrobiales bacterium]
MSHDECELFDAFCESQSITPSEALRRLARGAALLGPTYADQDRAEIIGLTRQLRGIGTNLNQAVHHMNAGHVIQGQDLAAYLDSVRDAITELDRAYRSLCVRTHRRAVASLTSAAP